MKIRARYEPQQNYDQSGKECPLVSDPASRLRGEPVKALFIAVAVCAHRETLIATGRRFMRASYGICGNARAWPPYRDYPGLFLSSLGHIRCLRAFLTFGDFKLHRIALLQAL